MPGTILKVLYGEQRRDQTGRPAHRREHHLQKHMDVFCDDVGNEGIGKVYEAKLDDDGLLPIMTEYKGLLKVPPTTVQPLASLSKYEVERALSVAANNKVLKDMFKDMPEVPPATPKGKGKKRGRDDDDAEPPPALTRKKLHATRQSARFAGPSDAQSSGCDAETSAIDSGAAGGDEAGAADNGADFDGADSFAGDEGAAAADAADAADAGAAGEGFSFENSGAANDKSLQAMFASFANQLLAVVERRMDLVQHGLKRELHDALDLKESMPKSKKRKVTLEEQAAVDFPWDLFDEQRSPKCCFSTVKAKLKPFLKNMSEPFADSLLSNISPKQLHMTIETVMTIIFIGIEGTEPSSELHVELVDAGRYVVLRNASYTTVNYLKARFFKSILERFQHVITAASIDKGLLHDVDSLFTSPWDEVTTFATYGVSTQREDKDEPIVIAATNQHLPAWSTTMLAKNLTTGETKRKPYLGGPRPRAQHTPRARRARHTPALLTSVCPGVAGGQILDGFIKEVSKGEDELVKLDALAVLVAYWMVKMHDINVNHGFDLGLAAGEWKKWCDAPSAPNPRLCRTQRRPISL